MKKIAKLGCLSVVITIFLAGFGCYWLVWHPNTTVQDDGIIYIRKGDSFETVMQTLLSKGYILNEYTLRMVADFKKYPHHIKAGRYRIADGMNNNQLLNLLRSGAQEAVCFIFNSIRTLEDFAGTISRQLAIDSVDFLTFARDSASVAQYGFTTDNFIGMFIPNTYHVYWNTSLPDFVKRMNREYKAFWTPERMLKSEKAGLSPKEVITIASIVEEETNIPQEYPVIAGVYINRLQKGWRLEACPTLKFALGDFSIQRILAKHKYVDSPYNTYKYAGIPPGPVRMPSIQVIDATLNYAHHQYMFFCAKSDFSGTHHFSRTLREHNNYAVSYHQALNRKNIYQ